MAILLLFTASRVSFERISMQKVGSARPSCQCMVELTGIEIFCRHFSLVREQWEEGERLCRSKLALAHAIRVRGESSRHHLWCASSASANVRSCRGLKRI